MSDFKVGETVRLKSGGPTMTIESLRQGENGTRAWCVWFLKNEKHEGYFGIATLTADDGLPKIA